MHTACEESKALRLERAVGRRSYNFDYGGPLTETVLRGDVGYRFGGFDRDADNLKAEGNVQAQTLIHESYRKGWEIT